MPKRPNGMARVAEGMLFSRTPVEYHEDLGLWVKREDLSCPDPGPHFSKTRGVYAHVKSRPEYVIGALDTFHSQAGHAVARACQILGKRCVNYYPKFVKRPEPGPPQLRAQDLGAKLVGLKATMSAVLWHQARKDCEDVLGGYMMPNALKLQESVDETAKEVPAEEFDLVIVPMSSGTIAAGVIKGFLDAGRCPRFLLHMGYSRSADKARDYVAGKTGYAPDEIDLGFIDEGYQYKDVARPGVTPPFPCNQYYDLKAIRWWMDSRDREEWSGYRVLFWNIG